MRRDVWLALLLAVLAAWGLRRTVLEGFVYAWPREFRGDFYAAMYVPDWWDGRGIMYGPVFVLERWLVNAWPKIFTIYTFALANVPAVALALVLSLRAVRATRRTAWVVVTAWCCFQWLFYAFSVAANPEILEMLLLTAAWYAAARAKATAAWVAVVVAGLTKVFPIIFAPLLILRASRRAMVAGAVTAVAIIAVVGVGQQLSPVETAKAILIPIQSTSGTTLPQASQHLGTFLIPVPSANQLMGLNTALARAFNMGDSDPRLAAVQTITNTATVLIYVWSVFVAFVVLRGRHALSEVTRLALAYGLFLALMPLATFHAHPHTFVFMLPAWTAIVATLADDEDRTRAVRCGAAFVVLFVLGGLPSVATPIDRLWHTRWATWLGRDPIWASIGVVFALSGYALVRTRELRAALQTS
ncbi:MAG: glycosyltransferase 87 family protein [Acidobacteriia bacterium]|nr:glycosyltransferase 87 family protein [Terriglobia bacterium]